MENATAYQLTKRSYYADFFTVPAATSVAVFWLLSLHNFNPLVFFSSVAAGILGWTFFEYTMHRWGFHSFGSKEHRFHHIFPRDFIGVSPLTTAAIGAFAFWILTSTCGPLIGVGLLVGLVTGYMFYIFVHDRMHHSNVKRGTYLALLNSNHDYHHARFRVNYGVITPAWDFIFGTYQRNPARPSNEI